MSLDFPMRSQTAARMRAPNDGIVASQHAQGWIAKRWLSMLNDLPPTLGPNLARGRALARTGRVRDLWFASGLANAEVVDDEVFVASVRVKPFSDAQWDRVVRALLGDLSVVADLLEGTLDPKLPLDLARAGIHLVPRNAEIESDCQCSDFMVPCRHVAALHALLADALDGDPLLLFTLRGKSRDELGALLRAAWGDVGQQEASEPDLVPVPDDDDAFFYGRNGPARIPIVMRASETVAAGVTALGPAPGDVDLEKALGPLYEAGAKAAIELALAEGPESDQRWRRARTEVLPLDEDWTEKVVDALCSIEPATDKQVAAKLQAGVHEVRRELLELETQGMVVRTANRDGSANWMLG
jgi:uncharacterized Zn finger protein